MSSENPKETRDQAGPEEQEEANQDTEASEQSVEAADEADAGQDENELQGLLEKALEEVEKYKDMALRAEAEVQNVQRRAERDVANAHKYGSEKLVQSLLPVVDSLEKAIEAAEQSEGKAESDDAILEGVRLCHKLFLDVLGKQNVAVVDPEGEPFDPNEHEAMSMVEHAEMEPNSVVKVIQKGYKLNERLVRPAMVIVSRAPQVQESGDE